MGDSLFRLMRVGEFTTRDGTPSDPSWKLGPAIFPSIGAHLSFPLSGVGLGPRCGVSRSLPCRPISLFGGLSPLPWPASWPPSHSRMAVLEACFHMAKLHTTQSSLTHVCHIPLTHRHTPLPHIPSHARGGALCEGNCAAMGTQTGR